MQLLELHLCLFLVLHKVPGAFWTVQPERSWYLASYRTHVTTTNTSPVFPRSWFRCILRFTWQASHCYELSYLYGWWSNWPLLQLFLPTADISASRGLTLCKQPNSEIYDLGNEGGEGKYFLLIRKGNTTISGHPWKKIQLLVFSTLR